MKIKQTILLISALIITTILLYPMYINMVCDNNGIELKKEIKEKNSEILILKDSLAVAEEEVEILQKEVERLQEENETCMSVLGEIEFQPGGHEILKYLWGLHSK